MLCMLKSREGQVSKRSTLKEPFRPETEKAEAPQAMKKRKAGQRRKRRVGEIVERRKIQHALATRRLITWRVIAGSDLIFNVEAANNLDTWKMCAKIKGSNSRTMFKLRLLMETKLWRSICSLPLVLFQAAKSIRVG